MDIEGVVGVLEAEGAEEVEADGTNYEDVEPSHVETQGRPGEPRLRGPRPGTVGGTGPETRRDGGRPQRLTCPDAGRGRQVLCRSTRCRGVSRVFHVCEVYEGD